MIDGRLILAGLKALTVSLFLTPVVRDIFRSYNVVDRPGRRKVHAYPIPRVGGIPIALAYLFTLSGLFGPNSPLTGSFASALLPGAAIIFLTGLFDDFFNLQPRVKLLGQIVAAAAVFAAGLRLGPIGGVVLPLWLNFAITVFWLLLTTNALNLIDGLDGLCAGMGFIGALTFVAAGVLRGQTSLVWVAVPLAAALVGFLIHNFNPATVFLGDSGALLIGFLLGCFGLMWTGRGVTLSGLALPLMALSVPLMDLSLSIVRRTLKGQPIFAADRGHIHHRLLDRRFTVREAAVAMWTAAVFGGYFALLTGRNASRAAHLVSVLGFVATAAFSVSTLRYPEFEVAANLIFRGEFHRILAEKSRLRYLSGNLEKAQTEDEWWDRLVDMARELKWSRVRRIGTVAGADRVLREKTFAEFSASRPPVWSFRIALGPDDVLSADGDTAQGRAGIDLQAFSALVSTSFQARRNVRNEPARP